MSGLRLLTADMRRAEKRGPKVLIVGEPGVGKTYLHRTMSPTALASLQLLEAEAGDLPIIDLPFASIRPRTWQVCRDIACALGGPNPALPPTAAYSEAHYREVVTDPVLASLAPYTILSIDSFTQFSRLCRVWAEQQPEAVSTYGKKDLRAVYGLVARELISWLQQIQHARERTVILIAILEKATDDYGVSSWQIQLEGRKTARELPGIVDEVITLQWLDFGDGKRVRAFVCTQPNPWGFPAKDRSGRLDQIEEPHLGKLLHKLSTQEEKEI
jgi:AAA domain